MKPRDILEELKQGNRRFVDGETLMHDRHGQIVATAAAQYPLAVVLACMDSRIATEMIFDLRLGEVFSVRVAGNTVGARELGSIEYGCAVVGAKLVLVLGHTRCGAVTAAVDFAARGVDALAETGCEHVAAITDDIAESIAAETDTSADRTAGNEAFVDRVAALNVRRTAEQICARSSTLRRLADEGEILLAGAIYDVKSGRVEFLDEEAAGAPA